jgi:SagB-type dehydrogenase family enzyme
MQSQHERSIMKKTTSIVACLVFIAMVICPALTSAQEQKPVLLPAPQMDGGKPLMEVLKNRSTSREFSTEKLPMQVLSNLLWAAYGINRPDAGKRTAPSAKNWQEIDIYVATADALYLYDAAKNALNIVMTEDIRAYTGKQGFVKIAPVNLVFVANFSKITTENENDKILYTAADTGFISQNVYLFCASEGLATVVRGYVDKPALEKKMGLSPDQKVILAQTVGYPKK